MKQETPTQALLLSNCLEEERDAFLEGKDDPQIGKTGKKYRYWTVYSCAMNI